MSQIWNFLHGKESHNEEEEDEVDYFNHHIHPELTKHSKESDSTVEADGAETEAKTPREENNFNSQLKRRLSSLKSQKKQQQQQQHQNQQTSMNENVKKNITTNRHERGCKKNNGGNNDSNAIVSDDDNDDDERCDCLIDEQDDQVNEIVSPMVIKSGSISQASGGHGAHQQSIDSHLLSPSSLSTTSSLIFERNVQDQIQMTSCSASRRNSTNPLGRSHSYSSQSSIPLHLNSEFFVPQVLDATTEVLNDPNYENIEVIQLQNSHNNLSSTLLDQAKNSATTASNNNNSISGSSATGIHPGMGNRRMSRSLPISRRQSSCAPLSPISTTSTSISQAQNIDYSDRKKLNFYSFADLLNDETDTGLVSPTSPPQPSTQLFGGNGANSKNLTMNQLRDPFQSDHYFNPSNSTIHQAQEQPPQPPFLSQGSQSHLPVLSKTSSIKEILLENQTELGKAN